jgi:hypothetical protein
MKQTIPYGDTYETHEGTALHIAIGAANYWHKRAEHGFNLGFLAGAVSVLASGLIGYWVFF